VARLMDSSSSEAMMSAECVLCTRLSCDAGHSLRASSTAAVLTTSRPASTSSASCFCCSRAVSSSTGFTQAKEAHTVYVHLQEFLKYRRSGSNRHGALAPPDFESENPRPGASYHVLVCNVDMPKTRTL
jgi:hypothetical protein